MEVGASTKEIEHCFKLISLQMIKSTNDLILNIGICMCVWLKQLSICGLEPAALTGIDSKYLVRMAKSLL